MPPKHIKYKYTLHSMLLLTKDYVRLALTGEVASEPTDAGGTQLMDCRTGQWDHQLCEIAGWNPDHLPPLTQAWQAAGGLRPQLAARWGMKPGIPVAAGAGDNMASTLGASRLTPSCWGLMVSRGFFLAFMMLGRLG